MCLAKTVIFDVEYPCRDVTLGKALCYYHTKIRDGLITPENIVSRIEWMGGVIYGDPVRPYENEVPR